MSKHLSRRQLLQALAAAAGRLGLGVLTGCAPSTGRAEEGLQPQAYVPLIINSPTPTPDPPPTEPPPTEPPPTVPPPTEPPPTEPPPTEPPPTEPPPPPPTGSRVVHVHSDAATSWDFATGWYGDNVDQDAVNAMVDEGVKQLTDQTSVTTAWRTILPNYEPGEGIAIKVNFNNSGYPVSENRIDALIEPVNALVRGMKAAGVREEDVWVYDALRPIPNHFIVGCMYPGIRFFDTGTYAERAGFTNTYPDAEVLFTHSELTSRRITDVLVNATYVINMPILKDHGYTGVTLSFKNHFGSIDEIVRAGEDDLHSYISPGDPGYATNYSPLVELYLNSHIQGKTVLTLGDGLYGALGSTKAVPSRWTTFSDASPNSLFFAMDPVAVDCVMLDILDAEPVYHPRRPGAEDYLRLGADAGLGAYERGDPWGSGYDHIIYSKHSL